MAEWISVLRKLAIKTLLRILNGRLLNQSPCQYAYVGNVDAFSYSHLASEERQRPGVSVAQILKEADDFRCCPIGKGLTVIEDGAPREGTVWDVHELRQRLSPEPPKDGQS